MPSRYDLHTHSLPRTAPCRRRLSWRRRMRRASEGAGAHRPRRYRRSRRGAAARAQADADRRRRGVCHLAEPDPVHIVGLNKTPHAELQQGLAGGCASSHRWRAQKIDRRLAKKRILGALDGAASHAHGVILSRTHFARFLVERGHARDLKTGVQIFLTRGQPGYVPGRWAPPLADAVRWIRDAGGTWRWSRTRRAKLTAGKLARLFGEFKGAAGRPSKWLPRRSRRRNLPVTSAGSRASAGCRRSVGSDYHGPGQSWCDLGQTLSLPELCTGMASKARPTGGSARCPGECSFGKSPIAPSLTRGHLPPVPSAMGASRRNERRYLGRSAAVSKWPPPARGVSVFGGGGPATQRSYPLWRTGASLRKKLRLGKRRPFAGGAYRLGSRRRYVVTPPGGSAQDAHVVKKFHQQLEGAMDQVNLAVESVRGFFLQLGEFMPKLIRRHRGSAYRLARRPVSGAARGSRSQVRQLQRHHREGRRRRLPAPGGMRKSTIDILGLLVYWLVIW